MKVTITAHNALDTGDLESHLFYFLVEDQEGEARTACVNLRTARVLARELSSRTALDAMLREIVATSVSDFDGLIGSFFEGS
ncbi:hypothetical protein AWB77_00500 [Caballeronia fortuita]|uniref:Uncharacterized protein n=1 Tax=Caballeronia fortuita TaxID=1777138 RepID=A0A157ZD64_9BURK|nr:hypothetical protein [Caballeronia fortuita]SAK42827.1 hypothetical protein AWB77_00500 [Caballeronia fortuita]